MEHPLLPKIKHLNPIADHLRSRHALRVEVLDAPDGQSLRLGAVVVPVYGADPDCQDLWNFRSSTVRTHMHGYPNGARDIFIAQLADVLRGRGMGCCDPIAD